MKSQFICASSHKVLWILLFCRICEELIRSKPDLLHGRDRHGFTPLLKIFAEDVPLMRGEEENHGQQKQEKYVKVIDTLIDMGAELDVRDNDGWNALHWIAYRSLTHLGKVFVRRLQEASKKYAEIKVSGYEYYSSDIIWYPEWVVNATNTKGEVSFVSMKVNSFYFLTF